MHVIVILSCDRKLTRDNFRLHQRALWASSRPGGPGGPGPSCPQDFFKIMQFSGNFKGKTSIFSKFRARALPWGQNSTGPPWPKSWIRACEPCWNMSYLLKSQLQGNCYKWFTGYCSQQRLCENQFSTFPYRTCWKFILRQDVKTGQHCALAVHLNSQTKVHIYIFCLWKPTILFLQNRTDHRTWETPRIILPHHGQSQDDEKAPPPPNLFWKPDLCFWLSWKLWIWPSGMSSICEYNSSGNAKCF